MTGKSKVLKMSLAAGLCGCALFLAAPSPLLAAVHHAEEPTFDSLSRYIVNFSIFIALAVGINFWLGNPLKQAWQRRWKRIEHEIRAGLGLLSEAETRLQRVREMLKDINVHIKNMRDRIHSDAEHETAAIIEAARQKADALAVQARRTVELERRAAQESVRNELVEQIVAQAAEELQQAISIQDDRARRRSTLSKVHSLLQ